jgi:CBS domain-containing protein
VAFIAEHMTLVGAGKANKRVADMKLPKHVYSIDSNKTAFEAFQLMIEHKISGIAVVDDVSGKLVGNVSVRDLKVVQHDARFFFLLGEKLSDFLKTLQKSSKRPATLITCKPSDTFATVIALLAKHKIHRLYVVDEAMRPLSVCSLKDAAMEILI